MKIFQGNRRDLPEKRTDDHRGKTFEADIGHFNPAGGLELLAVAGVRYHTEYYEAVVAGGLEPLVTDPETEKSKPKAEANKSKNPGTENK